MYIDQLNEGLACLPCHGGPALDPYRTLSKWFTSLAIDITYYCFNVPSQNQSFAKSSNPARPNWKFFSLHNTAAKFSL